MASLTAKFCLSVAVALLMLSTGILSADAADRVNRSTPSDVAAGRWMDAFLDPSTPLPAAKPRRAPRQQRRRVQRHSGLTGKLVRNSDVQDGSPPFALVDRYGGVLRYIEPVKSVPLEKYLDKTVAVRHDTGDTLLASQLNLPRVNNVSSSTTGLQLAQNLEPIPAGAPEPAVAGPLPAGEVIGESRPIQGIRNEPVYVDEGYEGGLDFGGCTSCGDVTCGGGGGCGYGARGVMYFHGEYLLWRLKGMNTPPLVVQFENVDSNVNVGTDDDGNGAVDDNAAVGPFSIIFGGNETLDDERNGGRFTWGLWLDDYGQWGIGADFLFLEDLEESFTAGTFDGQIPAAGSFIGRPFFNTGVIGGVLGGRGPAVEDVDTNALDGTVTVDIESEFRSAGFRLRHNLCCRPSCDTCCGDGVCCGSGIGCGTAVGEPLGLLRGLRTLLHKGTRHSDVFGGFRWYSLDENLTVTEDLQTQAAPISQIDVIDSFGTENDFLGGEIGYETDWKYRRWSLNFLSKIAIGNTRQRARNTGVTFVDGTEVNPPNNTGGLLVQNTVLASGAVVGNAGTFERDEFTMIPELGLTLGYDLTRRLKLTAGYTVLYWGNVLRPGDQIDIDVNGNLIPRDGGPPAGTVVGGDAPRFEFNQTDVWAQGLNLGAEYTW